MNRFGELRPDCLQVVLLGPGFGESVLVRVPGVPAGWLVVDSLLSDRRGEARCAVLDALDELGAEPDLVLLTHAHSDHAGGMDSLVERFCNRALFGAVKIDLGTTHNARMRAAAQGQEVAAALRAINQLPEERRWDLDAPPALLGTGSVRVLHPSPARLAALGKLRSVGPNRFSSALLVEWGTQSVMLGADLERPEWVSLAHAGRLASSNPVKVPHHGSPGAFDTAWVGDRVTEPANATRRMLVAPFDRRPKLPDLDHVDGLPGLLNQVDEVDLTSLPFETEPSVTGRCTLAGLRESRDQAKANGPPLPAVFGTPSPRQAAPPEREAWVLAELSINGSRDVRGGAVSLKIRL